MHFRPETDVQIMGERLRLKKLVKLEPVENGNVTAFLASDVKCKSCMRADVIY